MLEAADYNAIDQEFPFSGENIDTCFGTSTSAPVNNVCITYVALVNRIYRRFHSPEWTEVTLVKWERPINIFKRMARAVFGPHQASCLETSNWLALNSLVGALRQLRSIEYTDAGCFENSHRR